MNTLRMRGTFAGALVTLGLLALSTLGQTNLASAANEQTFDSLQIGTHEYRNVTVTTKSKDYVFILHSAGMTNIKVSELPAEVREKLGYANPETANVRTNAASVWAKQTFAKLQTPQVKGVEQEVLAKWQTQADELRKNLPPITSQELVIAGAVVAALYLFWCYCAMLICQKAGQAPGVLVWLPLLQLFPLLRAANMSAWWFFAYFLPGLSLVAHVMWCVKISSVRGKNLLVAILLLLPVTNLLAVLYLAFSDGAAAPRKKEEQRLGSMTLEAA